MQHKAALFGHFFSNLMTDIQTHDRLLEGTSRGEAVGPGLRPDPPALH